MRKVTLTLASAIFAISTAGIGAALAQSAPAPADTTTAAPGSPTTVAPQKHATHQKVAMNKQKAKAPKKAMPKKAAPATTDDSTSSE